MTRAKQKRTKPKALSPRDERKVKNALLRMPHLTRKTIFEAAGLSEVLKSTRNVYDYLKFIRLLNIKKDY